ncbi:MAG: HrpE/YscL family type III secretion apparatus protein [Chlamydiia bacterium]|nr:HrpE/YscL family type III secretion apparatus protein [Chlamydiia bacterium]
MKYFAIVDSQTVHPGKEDKVIPADEFSTLLEAKELLEKVQQNAEAQIERAKKNSQNIRKKAKAEGFQEGLNQLNEHILQFENQIKHLRHETQKQILPLALKAAKKIVNRELEVDPNVIIDIVTGALRPVTQYKQVKIYVHKSDKEILEKEKDNIKKILDQVQSFSIVERDDVEVGGCIIETEAGIINASLENQWRSLEAAFETFMKLS